MGIVCFEDVVAIELLHKSLQVVDGEKLLLVDEITPGD